MAVKRHSAGRVSQPSGPVPISDYWLKRGLVFLHLGNGLFWTKSQGWMGTASFVGTPKNQTSKYGVVKGLGTTYGGGTTDRITPPSIPFSTGFRSYVVTRFANTTGGGGFGRIVNVTGSTGLDANAESLYPNGATNGIIYTKAGATAWQWAQTAPITTGVWAVDGITHDQRTTGVTPLFYLNGIAVAVTILGAAGSGSYPTGNFNFDIGNRSTDSLRNWDGMLGPLAIFDHPSVGLTDAEHKALNDNIWQVLAARLTRRTIAGGGTTHTTTGALVASAATIAGTATHLTLHTTSGSFTAQASTIAGAALRFITHTTTGALVAGSATISGAAAHQHAAIAALIAGSATIAGTATRATGGSHPTSGAFVAGAAVLAGTATHLTLHATSGGLVAGAATVSGTAAHKTLHTTTGGLVAGSATLAATAVHTTVHASTGALVASSASINGIAYRPIAHATSGALVAGVAQISAGSFRYLPSPNTAAPALSWVGSDSDLFYLTRGEKGIPTPRQANSSWAKAMAQVKPQGGLK